MASPNDDFLNDSVQSPDEPLAKDVQEPLQLIVTRPQDVALCPFWVGLYKAGSISPQEIFRIPEIESILQLLVQQGLHERTPLMLSDNSFEAKLRQFYLLPEQSCREQPEEVRELLVSTLEALRPSSIGLYFAPDTLGMHLSTHLIEEITLGLSFLRTKEIYFFTGKIGVNPLLNAALRVKSRLAGRREIFVYH